MSASPAVPRLVVGHVRHLRMRPVVHELRYASWFLMLPLRRLREAPCPLLNRNRRGWISFRDADHGDGGSDCLRWIDALLASRGIVDAGGEVWLQTMPRVFGHAFKPVSFWYCHRADGSLRAVVAEVNNTFGERHCYVLDAPTLDFGVEQRTGKVFHVSPFCDTRGVYRFRFLRSDLRESAAGHVRVHIDHDDDDGPLLSTCVAGAAQPLTAAGLRRAMWQMPLAVTGVLLRIHWQALRLWLKRVPWFTKPAPPSVPASR